MDQKNISATVDTQSNPQSPQVATSVKEGESELLKSLINVLQQNQRGHSMGKPVSSQEVGVLPDQVENVFQFVRGTPQGLRRIAAVMQEPLKERIDYYGIGRRLLLVHEVPVGDFPIYDKDIPEFAAVKIAALGAVTQVEYRLKRIQIPTHGLGRAYRFGYEEQQVRLFPLFDRAKERVAIAIAIAEDYEIFSLLDKGAFYGPNPPLSAFGPITRVALSEAWGVIASRQLIPANVVMHPSVYKDILKWGSQDLDQVTLNVTTETGQIGQIFGMQLLVSPKAKKDAVYVTTTPNKLGRIPVRKEMEVKVFDYVPKACFIVLAWEQIGFGIHNTYGIAKLCLTEDELNKSIGPNIDTEIGLHMKF